MCLGPDAKRTVRAKAAFALRLDLHGNRERRGDDAFGEVVAGARYARNAAPLAVVPRLVIPFAA
jgi:hypothetical protein